VDTATDVAKIADKAVDTVKLADKASDVKKIESVEDILEMGVDKFKSSRTAAQRLMKAATHVRDFMYTEVSTALEGMNAHVDSILKRNTIRKFKNGVAEKVTRQAESWRAGGGQAKGVIGEMWDIARGRACLDTVQDVNKAVDKLVDYFKRNPDKGSIAHISPPRADYPRFHVFIKNAATGITYELQVGTKATTAFLEKVKLALPKRLSKKIGDNFHDVFYDHMLAMKKDHPVLFKKYKLDMFEKPYLKLLKETGKGTPAGLQARANKMARVLTRIVMKIDKERPGFLESLSHK
jgi:hypothetical protein